MIAHHVVRRLPLALSLAALAALTACDPPPRMVEGECGTVYGAQVCTWGTFAGQELLEFGATIPLATIEAAPAEAEMAWPPVTLASLRLPAEVREASGFDHLGINWEPHGHPPATFMTPHFDFHFYSMSPADIAAVDCSDLEKPSALPAGYALPDMDIPGLGTLVGVCVPTMGMHALPQDQLDKTDLFQATMIVGYYRRSPMSVEPMISRDKLREARSFALEVPALPDHGAVKTWPVGFEAVYDAPSQAYRFTFRTAKRG